MQHIYKDYKIKLKNSFFILVLFSTVFIAGLLNSKDYLLFMGLNEVHFVLKTSFYILIIISSFIFILKRSLIKRTLSLRIFKYWAILLFGILFKYFILFVQDPYSIFPGGNFFNQLTTFVLNFLLMILIVSSIKNNKTIKLIIWALGLGTFFSAFIPLILFPEMIGTRIIEFQGYKFIGAFWNSSLISYISVGWLLISILPMESFRLKKILIISLFIILVFGGIAGLSRSILLSILLAGVIYLFFIKKFKKYVKVVIFGIIIVFFIVKLSPDIILKFTERLETGIEVKDEARVDIWWDYLEDLPSYILFGEIEGNYKRFSDSTIIEFGPHSVLLNWLVQFGLFGLVGFLTLIYGVIKSIAKIKLYYSNETSAALYAWVATYLSVALINETEFDQLTIFAAFGIIIGWGNLVEKYKNSSNN